MSSLSALRSLPSSPSSLFVPDNNPVVPEDDTGQFILGEARPAAAACVSPACVGAAPSVLDSIRELHQLNQLKIAVLRALAKQLPEVTDPRPSSCAY